MIWLDITHIIQLEQNQICIYLDRLFFLDVFRNSFSYEYTNTCCFEIACINHNNLPEFASFYMCVQRMLINKGMMCSLGIHIPDWAFKENESLFFGELECLIQLQANISFAGFQSYPTYIFTQDNSIDDFYWKHFHENKVQKIQLLLKQCDLEKIPLYLTHWNTLACRNQAEAGSFFRSALIMHTILKLCNNIAVTFVGQWRDCQICSFIKKILKIVILSI